MKKRTFKVNDKNIRIALIFRVFYASMSAILLPLLIFVGGGWWMDRLLGTGRIFLFSGVAFSFVATQLLLFFQIKKFSRNVDIVVDSKEKEVDL